MNLRRFKFRFPRRLYGAAAVVLAAAAALVMWWSLEHSSEAPGPSSESPTASQSTPEPISTLPFDKSEHSTDRAASLWAVVNKGRALPGDFVPPSLISPKILLRLSPSVSSMYLRKDAAEALEKMAAEAKKANIHLMLASGYRSYGDQKSVYSSFVAVHGQAQTDLFSARPGHSEHQTGLAADLEPSTRKCELEACFGETAEGKWLAKNAHRFGFIIRYPASKTNLTGYDYEPWHLRFVGTALAGQLYRSGLTLEQFFGLQLFTSYPASSFVLEGDN